MENKQFNLCLEILHRFNKAGILDDLILIGSWCLYFYKHYYFKNPSLPYLTIKTRDIDFLISKPAHIKKSVNIPNLLQDLGFITEFMGEKGYIKLDHPDLIVEFLVPELGKGKDAPFPLPNLGLNATPLRFLTFLSQNVIKIEAEGLTLNLPHPANFALHKLIIFQRRVKQEKAERDKRAAIELLNILISRKESANIQAAFISIPIKWRKKIILGLNKAGEKEMISFLSESS